MIISTTNRYLVLASNRNAPVDKLLIYVDKKLVCDLDVKPAGNMPSDFNAFIDISRFGIPQLEVRLESGNELKCSFSDELISEIGNLRPKIHFTTKNGWINDPNGLVYYKGNYHLFYQYNPCLPSWGNMHWGHSVSTDLIHYEELEPALFPDELGTMFSGSAIVDVKNLTNLKENENDVILLYYTAAGGSSKLSAGKSFTQCLAYSTDGGYSFRKYDKNPIVPHIEGENRDPKVIFCDEINKYVMALYLSANRYMLLSSDDLLNFKQLMTIELQNDAECPDFFPLTADDGTRKWILSGASHNYLVGDIKNGLFVPCQEAKSLHYSNISYASQTFSDIPDGRRINIAWDRIDVENQTFNCQMGIPCELTLETSDEGYMLAAKPVQEFFDSVQTTAGNCAYYLSIQITSDSSFSFKLSSFGINFICSSEIGISIENIICPIRRIDNKYEFSIIFDSISAEILTTHGRYAAVISCRPDFTKEKASLTELTDAPLPKIEVECFPVK